MKSIIFFLKISVSNLETFSTILLLLKLSSIFKNFFKENSKGSLIEAIKKFLKMEDNFNSSKIVENASRFDTDIFKKNIIDFINQKYNLKC